MPTQTRTCASLAVDWSELFHVCYRDFINGYLSGALCFLDQAGLPTHSHLSEHSSDEITHTGISAVCLCVCFVHVFWCDTLLMLRMREDRCLYLDMGTVRKKLPVDFLEMLCLFFLPYTNITTVTGANVSIHTSAKVIRLISLQRNSLNFMTLQNHLFCSHILRQFKSISIVL